MKFRVLLLTVPICYAQAMLGHWGYGYSDLDWVVGAFVVREGNFGNAKTFRAAYTQNMKFSEMHASQNRGHPSKGYMGHLFSNIQT